MSAGPLTASWQARWDDALMGNYGTPPVVLARGSGATVWDVDGKRYVDLLGGIAVNLLGHAGRKRAEGAAHLLDTDVEEVCRQARAPVLLGPSVKAALDIDWSDAEAKQDALNRLVRQVDRVAAWVERHVSQAEESPLRRSIEALRTGEGTRLGACGRGRGASAPGVAPDRRVSIEDEEVV